MIFKITSTEKLTTETWIIGTQKIAWVTLRLSLYEPSNRHGFSSLQMRHRLYHKAISPLYRPERKISYILFNNLVMYCIITDVATDMNRGITEQGNSASGMMEMSPNVKEYNSPKYIQNVVLLLVYIAIWEVQRKVLYRYPASSKDISFTPEGWGYRGYILGCSGDTLALIYWLDWPVVDEIAYKLYIYGFTPNSLKASQIMIQRISEPSSAS